MTKEEIIRNLKHTMEKHKNDTVYTFGTNISVMCKDILDYFEEQEPCDDAISRDAAIKGIEELKKSPWATANRSHGYEYLITEALDVVKDLCVKQLPSVTQKSGWIPVSERLPEEAFGCLVTILDTDLRTQDEFENILPYFVGYDGETWNNADGEPIPFEVVAWMPLPKPYNSESENK